MKNYVVIGVMTTAVLSLAAMVWAIFAQSAASVIALAVVSIRQIVLIACFDYLDRKEDE